MSKTSPVVFDVGLQAERTALAWRRTALALAVGAVGAARLSAPVLGLAAVVLGAIGLAQAVFVAHNAGLRYQTAHRSLTTDGDLRGLAWSGLPLAALAVTGAIVALLALAFVLGVAD